MSYLPTFQPQNPAISGYSLGWSSCTAFAGAMAGDFDTLGKKRPTGQGVRQRTGDTVGGLNLAQVDSALNIGYGIDLTTVYRFPWADFAKKINAGCGAILQGGYAPIADSHFDAGRGFRGNHAVFVAPGWVAMDPLADGRASGGYKYHGEAYPQALLKAFAGRLNLEARAGFPPKLLGSGLVYAAFTRDNVHTYRLRFHSAFWVYELGPQGQIVRRRSMKFSRETSAPCATPARHDWPARDTYRMLVRMTSGALAGEYVGVPQSGVTLEVVP